MILGPSGAGKTALGRYTAQKLGFAFLDIDEFIWRKDTPKPFSVMYSREEKIARLQEAVTRAGRFVMAGSMDSFHQHFDPYFRLAVFLTAPPALRVERAHRRELEEFGARVLPGGDMEEDHRLFLEAVAGYEQGIGGMTLEKHNAWLSSLSCPVLRLDGRRPLEENAARIQRAWEGSLPLPADGRNTEESYRR